MTYSYWQRSLRELDLEVDVAVVGGGITGSSVAYWLRREAPALNVILLEAGRLAQGASGRNAGFLLQGIASDYVLDIERYGRERARELFCMTLENRELLTSELDPAAFDLELSGSMIAAGTPEERERLQRAETFLQDDGFEAEFLSESEVCQRLHARGFSGGLFLPTGAVCHPVKLVRHLADVSEATIFEHHPVMEVDTLGERLILETPARRVVARFAVFCLNGYLGRLFPELQEVIRPVRAQMLATRPLAKRLIDLPVYSHEGFYYVRQLTSGEVLAGGARHLHEEEEVGYEDRTTEPLQFELKAYLSDYFPDLPAVEVQHRWSGVMGFSEDRVPKVQQMKDVPRALWIGGYTGHGMALGFEVGRQAVENVLALS